jgi:hypothetical protein
MIVNDPITNPPDMGGAHGRAWLINFSHPSWSQTKLGACVALWVIEAPSAHPAWHSYVMSLIHLRPIPGLEPPIMYVADATHEMVLAALDPDKPRQPAIDGCDLWPLNPPNFAAQFTAENDAAAMAHCEQSVRAIVAGQLSPDTDHTHAWIDRFGDGMVRR